MAAFFFYPWWVKRRLSHLHHPEHLPFHFSRPFPRMHPPLHSANRESSRSLESFCCQVSLLLSSLQDSQAVLHQSIVSITPSLSLISKNALTTVCTRIEGPSAEQVAEITELREEIEGPLARPAYPMPGMRNGPPADSTTVHNISKSHKTPLESRTNKKIVDEVCDHGRQIGCWCKKFDLQIIKVTEPEMGYIRRFYNHLPSAGPPYTLKSPLSDQRVINEPKRSGTKERKSDE